MNPHEKVQEYLDAVAKEIAFKEARPGIRQELYSHIEDHIRTAQSYGLDSEQAVADSLRRMGDASEVGLSLNGVHQSKTDFLIVLLVAILCSVGLYIVNSRGWAGLQALWMTLGIAFAVVSVRLPYLALMRSLASLYVVAVLGLVSAQFSSLHIDGQPYLAILGLKIKIVDLASMLMALSLPAIGEMFPGRRLIMLPILILVPVLYFCGIGSIFPAALLIIGGVVVIGQYNRPSFTIFVGALGSLFLAFWGFKAFLPAEQLEVALSNASHTDFAVSTLMQASAVGAALVVALFAVFLVHLSSQVGGIKTQWLRATAICCAAPPCGGNPFGITSNYGVVPMFKTGANIPFLSYGGSLLVVHFMMIGVVLACLRRKSVHYS